MPGPITQAGGIAEPSEYAPLTMDEHFTGLWTQRNPLRDADVPYLYRKYYSASRFDSLIDGLNREITARLTSARRAGTAVYNSNTFPAVNSFYAFKYVQSGSQTIRVVADGKDLNVYDATAGQKTTLFAKDAGAGKTRFLGVGPTLYTYDGATPRQTVRSPLAWAASKLFGAGQYIVDTNLNVQLSVGSQTATITAIQVDTYTMPGGTTGRKVTLYFDAATPITVPDSIAVTLSGLTTVPSLNGTTPYTAIVVNSTQLQFTGLFFGVPVTAYAAETGTATTGDGTTGTAQPAWSSTIGEITQDGGEQWECRGSSVRPLGYAAPANAPVVSQAVAPTLYDPWAADTWYGPAVVLVDSNSNVQQLTTSGTTGSSAPTWATAVGATTTDGTAVWTNRGPAAWAASTAYIVGAIVSITFSYTITYSQSFPYPPYHQETQKIITVTYAFMCTTAGTSGANQPNWSSGIGTTTQDNTATWTNIGIPTGWSTIGATTKVSTDTSVVDTNGNVQAAQEMAKSGATAPTWPPATSASVGVSTTDGNQLWLCNGPYAAANTGAWIYSYSGQDSVTGDVTTESPISSPIIQAAGKQIVIQGDGLDLRMDSLILWRTAQGGKDRVYLDTIPNPGTGQSFIYTDTTPDVPANGSPGLNALIESPRAGANNPPPSTATAPEYHGSRVWAIDANYVRYSGGPDTLIGNGNNTFYPQNYFLCPEQPMRLKSITVQGGGLLVIGTANTYIILGNGTDAAPYLPPRMYMAGVGIGNYDASCMVGSTLYGFSSQNKAFSFDPSGGYTEIGFPIGDQMKKVTTGGINSALYSPQNTMVTWHEKDSGDTGLYLCDGAAGWFRFSPIAPPEAGSLWSVRTAITDGTSAVQSIETSTGNFELLIAPAASGTIRKRDTSQTGDWSDTAAAYVGFPSWDVRGSIRLCETGEVAEIAHVALTSMAVGARPSVSLLLDEIAAGVTVDGVTTTWDVLELDGQHQEPPLLEPSITMYSDRYTTLQNGITPKCQNFQLKVDYGSQLAADELLMFAVYGAVSKETKQQ